MITVIFPDHVNPPKTRIIIDSKSIELVQTNLDYGLEVIITFKDGNQLFLYEIIVDSFLGQWLVSQMGFDL